MAIAPFKFERSGTSSFNCG